MDPSWLKDLIADAEKVADASLRLENTAQVPLLNAISKARAAGNDAECEEAYRALQAELPNALRLIEPITLFDLQRSWVLNRGFCIRTAQLYGFWLLSVILLVIVAYTTSLYSKASDVSDTLTKYKDIRLTEQAVQVFNLARLHQDAIIKLQTSSDQALASDSFFRALADLQTTLNHINATITAANQIAGQLEFLDQIQKDICSLGQFFVGVVGGTMTCFDSRFALPPEPGLDSSKDQLLAVKAIQSDARPAAPMPDLDAFLNDADAFFQNVGVGLIQTRLAVPMFDFSLRRMKDVLDALRSWIVPAAYGSLGAAIFFTRRFLNPKLPNPETLRVIYRILFGGFAGIIFAWFWSPTMTAGAVSSAGSLSAFGIAFLAGYSTDILFRLLDRMVDAMGEQFHGKSPSGDR